MRKPRISQRKLVGVFGWQVAARLMTEFAGSRIPKLTRKDVDRHERSIRVVAMLRNHTYRDLAEVEGVSRRVIERLAV